MDEAAIARARIARRGMQRAARALAEREYETSPSRSRHAGNLKKRQRNRSAFISRQASRNYEHLLIAHLEREERERDEIIANIEKTAAQVNAMKAVLSQARAALTLVASTSQRPQPFMSCTQVNSPVSVMPQDYEIFTNPPNGRPFINFSAPNENSIAPLFDNPFDNISIRE